MMLQRLLLRTSLRMSATASMTSTTSTTSTTPTTMTSAMTSSPSRCHHLIHTSSIRRDLNEFFDDPENFSKERIRVGRAWREDELRLKSNQDLHKLWFVLLKERNMLLSMAHEYNQENVAMPNPERIDKVDESMENLESVVRERNRAFWELEVGGDGEPRREIIPGPFGLDVAYRQKEHTTPRELNRKWKGFMDYRYRTTFGHDVRSFYRKYREKEYKKLWIEKLTQLRQAAKTVQKFPNLDRDALEEKYPMITFEEAKRYYEARGHHRNDDLER